MKNKISKNPDDPFHTRPRLQEPISIDMLKQLLVHLFLNSHLYPWEPISTISKLITQKKIKNKK